MASGANFTAAINALVGERDRVFLVRVAEDFKLPFEQLSKLYLETAEQAIKVPRKYTKKPKTVAVVEEGATPAPAAAAPKKDKKTCEALTSKKEPCKFSALKGGCFCKRHQREQDEKLSGKVAEKPKKAAVQKQEQPVHTHPLDAEAKECELCESHGNPLAAAEEDFEVVLNGPALTGAERLAAMLASESDSDAESDHGSLKFSGEEEYEAED